MSIKSKKQLIIDFIERNKAATDLQVSEALSISKSYVKRIRETIQAEPKIIYKNIETISYQTSPWVKLLIIILAACIILFVKNCSNNSSQLQSLQAQLDESKYQSETWKDKYNREHIRVQEIELSKADMSKKFDSVANLLRIKPKQIISVVKGDVEIKIDKQLQVDTIYRDGKILDSFSYVDNYIDVRGWTGEEDGEIHITGKDTITYVEYWKRKWFLSQKQYYIDVSNRNPYIHFTGLKSFSISNQTPKWIIAPSLSAGYTIKGVQPMLGISAIYYPLSLKFY